MLVTKRTHKALQDKYDAHVRATNEKILKGNDRIVSAENQNRHLKNQLALKSHLLEQEQVAKAQARGDEVIARTAFQTIHRMVTQFRADPSRVDFTANEVRVIEVHAAKMGQSMKEWL